MKTVFILAVCLTCVSSLAQLALDPVDPGTTNSPSTDPPHLYRRRACNSQSFDVVHAFTNRLGTVISRTNSVKSEMPPEQSDPEPQPAQSKLTNEIPASEKSLLQTAQGFELFSLDPFDFQHPANVDFHGYRILGKLQITNATVRTNLVLALEKGIITDKWLLATEPVCFNPRHAIRVIHDETTEDFIICFECEQVYFGKNGVKRGFFRIDRSPEPVFDQVLENAKIQLAKKSH